MKQQEEKKMHALYGQWLSSGQSRAVFAKEHGLRATTFYYWAKKFEKQQPLAVPEQKAGFSLLSAGEPVPANSRPALALIAFPSGVSVELYWPVEAGFLKELAG
jgi:transposase-like protein